jgi:transcription antitermination factor NusG
LFGDHGPGHPWFALHVRARQEKTAAWALHNKGFEQFLPTYLEARRWSDRMKKLEVPLFPGYVFCRLDLRQRLAALKTPGVMAIVGIGKDPTPVENSEIAALQAIMRTNLPAVPWPFLQVGHRVRIEAGPLAGVEGILADFKSRGRLVVSVTLLQRSVLVDIERLQVIPIGLPRRLPVSLTAAAFPDSKTA